MSLRLVNHFKDDQFYTIMIRLHNDYRKLIKSYVETNLINIGKMLVLTLTSVKESGF